MTTTPPPPQSNSPYWVDSQDYWAGRRGATLPPAPSYRLVKGKQKLGRYLDPYGCMALVENQKTSWSSWYTRNLTIMGTSVIAAGISWLFIGVFAIIYVLVRWKYRRRYDYYWGILQEIERTGEPVWVPYSRTRLKMIDMRPNAVWP